MNLFYCWFLILISLCVVFMMLGFFFMALNYSLLIEWVLCSLNTSNFVIVVLFDWMSLLFMSCVLLISAMVVFYSSSYMYGDVFKVRFLYMVLLFVMSMMLLIVSPNIVSVLLGWDGLGLVSYCLVIYFQNFKSYNAGMLTILINRLGDVAFLISISWFFSLGSWNYIFFMYYYDWVYFPMLMIILAAFTSSAQMPFSSWLPAAMAAPTPVSALVHSSTLVTAGVYLLIRFSCVLYVFKLDWLLVLSILTMFMSSLAASFEYDLKKVIALSTLSQLGLMMSILFMGDSMLCFYHMLVHAFFKALLFLCAGLIIHCMNGMQDIRFMGFVVINLPYTSVCFFISNMSLCGIPFLSGFYSKELILDYMNFTSGNMFVYVMYYISLGLTVCYSFRVLWFCVSGFNGLFVYCDYNEDNIMMYSMVFLTFLSVVYGGLLGWLIFPYPNFYMVSLEGKLIPFVIIILSGYIGYWVSFIYYNGYWFNTYKIFVLEFFGDMWFIPYLTSNFMSPSFLLLGNGYFSFMSLGWGEYLTSNFMSKLFYYISYCNSIYQNNLFKFYFLSFFFMFLFIIML